MSLGALYQADIDKALDLSASLPATPPPKPSRGIWATVGDSLRGAGARINASLLEAGKVVVEAAGKAKGAAKTEMPVKRAGKAKGAVNHTKGTKVAPEAQNAPAATPDLPEGIAEVVVPVNNGLDGDQPANSTGM